MRSQKEDEKKRRELKTKHLFGVGIQLICNAEFSPEPINARPTHESAAVTIKPKLFQSLFLSLVLL